MRDRFDDKACELNKCTITDKSGPCSMFGCRRIAKELRIIHLEGRSEATADIGHVVQRQTKRTAVFLVLRAALALNEEIKTAKEATIL